MVDTIPNSELFKELRNQILAESKNGGKKRKVDVDAALAQEMMKACPPPATVEKLCRVYKDSNPDDDDIKMEKMSATSKTSYQTKGCITCPKQRSLGVTSMDGAVYHVAGTLVFQKAAFFKQDLKTDPSFTKDSAIQGQLLRTDDSPTSQETFRKVHHGCKTMQRFMYDSRNNEVDGWADFMFPYKHLSFEEFLDAMAANRAKFGKKSMFCLPLKPTKDGEDALSLSMPLFWDSKKQTDDFRKSNLSQLEEAVLMEPHKYDRMIYLIAFIMCNPTCKMNLPRLYMITNKKENGALKVVSMPMHQFFSLRRAFVIVKCMARGPLSTTEENKDDISSGLIQFKTQAIIVIKAYPYACTAIPTGVLAPKFEEEEDDDIDFNFQSDECTEEYNAVKKEAAMQEEDDIVDAAMANIDESDIASSVAPNPPATETKEAEQTEDNEVEEDDEFVEPTPTQPMTPPPMDDVSADETVIAETPPEHMGKKRKSHSKHGKSKKHKHSKKTPETLPSDEEEEYEE